MKKIISILKSEDGFIARGGFAVFLLIVFTILMLIDLVNGNTESFGTWLGMVIVSAVLTFGTMILKSIRRK